MQPLYFVMVFLKKAHTVNLEKGVEANRRLANRGTIFVGLGTV